MIDSKLVEFVEKDFCSVVKDLTSGNPKIGSKDYLIEGRFPIIDQGSNFCSGYTNSKELLCNIELPCIIFGDHTRVLKYVDTPFALGADGVKVLKPIKGLSEKYLFYFLKNLDIPSAGYSRHFKFLKENNIKYPLQLSEQKRIVSILDKADGIRQKREQAIKLADDFLRVTFLEMFSQLEHGANKVKLGDIVTLDAPMVDPKEEKYIDLIHIGPDRIEKKTGLLLPALTARDENLISKKFLFDENYVLYSKIRPYLKKCAIPDFSGLCSADMYPIKPIKSKTNREFLWQLLLSDSFTKYTKTLPDRANIPKLNRKELLNFEISLPPFSMQENYRAIVQKINNTKSIMRMQSSDNLLNRLTGKLFSKDQ